jgi:RimJ/RimL family protein N-acetyltransferase
MLVAVDLPPPLARPFPAEDARRTYVAYSAGRTLKAILEDGRLEVDDAGTGASSSWSVRDRGAGLALGWRDSGSAEFDVDHLLAALEAIFSSYPLCETVELDALPPGVARGADPKLLPFSLAPRVEVSREALWRMRRLWSPAETSAWPLCHVATGGRRHPRRPPKPSGVVYRRHIPWLGAALTFRALDAERDLPAFHHWMNDPVVAAFWQEEGDLSRHRAYLEAIAEDPHTMSLVGCFGDEAFGYFEVYWATEDRIGPYYDADDFDRGWHVLVGEPRFRGKPFVMAWMPSMSHHLFLDDCRTRRIVIEPRIDNHKMIRSLERCGYAPVEAVQLPHKRALLCMLARERFFGEALWRPQAGAAAAPESGHLSVSSLREGNDGNL